MGEALPFFLSPARTGGRCLAKPGILADAVRPGRLTVTLMLVRNRGTPEGHRVSQGGELCSSARARWLVAREAGGRG